MKKLLVLILCVPILLLFGFFQTSRYVKKLKPGLTQEAQNVMQTYGVKDGKVSIDRLDATLEGVVSDVEARAEVARKVSAIGGSGALRVQDANNLLKVMGSLEMSQQGETLHVTGDVAEESPLKSMGQKVVSEHGHLATVDNKVKASKVYVDPPFLHSAPFQKWLKGYFGFQGDQGFRYSAENESLTLFGSLTKELQNTYTPEIQKLAVEQGLDYVSEIKTIPSKAPTLKVARKDGQYTTEGVLSVRYEEEDLSAIPEHESISFDPYTHSTKGVDQMLSKGWVPAYFASSGDKSFAVKGDRVALAGVGTPLLQRDWLKGLRGFERVDQKGMELYPSEYHYPSYTVESVKDKEVVTKLAGVLSLNEIFFDVNSSEVKPSELPKIDQISQAVKAMAPDSNYVIGGHADATGNVDLNIRLSKERAQSVVNLLVQEGLAKDQFSIVPFGSAKSLKKGSNANDRRVEILLK